MSLDDNSMLKSVLSRSHLFKSCSTAGDNLFASVVINRGLSAAVADARHYRWTISRPLVDCIRVAVFEMLTSNGDPTNPRVEDVLGRLESPES